MSAASQGLSLLHLASSNGQADVVEMLLSHDTERAHELKDAQGHPTRSRQRADVHAQDIKVGHYLLCNCLHVRVYKRLRAMHSSTPVSATHVRRSCTPCFIDIKSIVMQGETVLHLAAAKGHEDIIKVLLAFGAEKEACTHQVSSAVHMVL